MQQNNKREAGNKSKTKAPGELDSLYLALAVFGWVFWSRCRGLRRLGFVYRQAGGGQAGDTMEPAKKKQRGEIMGFAKNKKKRKTRSCSFCQVFSFPICFSLV